MSDAKRKGPASAGPSPEPVDLDDAALEALAASVTGRARDAVITANVAAATFRAQLVRDCPALLSQFDDMLAAFRAARSTSVDALMEIYNA